MDTYAYVLPRHSLLNVSTAFCHYVSLVSNAITHTGVRSHLVRADAHDRPAGTELQ